MLLAVRRDAPVKTHAGTFSLAAVHCTARDLSGLKAYAPRSQCGQLHQQHEHVASGCHACTTIALQLSLI
jgi:hypothetical protein